MESKSAEEIELQAMGKPKLLTFTGERTNDRTKFTLNANNYNFNWSPGSINEGYEMSVSVELESTKINNYVKLKTQQNLLLKEQNALHREQNALFKDFIETIKYLPTMTMRGSEVNKVQKEFEDVRGSLE